jgi:hypothetical protein
MKKITFVLISLMVATMAFSQEFTLDIGQTNVANVYGDAEVSYYFYSLNWDSSDGNAFFTKFNSTMYLMEPFSEYIDQFSFAGSFLAGIGLSKTYERIAFKGGLDVSVQSDTISAKVFNTSLVDAVTSTLYLQIKFF